MYNGVNEPNVHYLVIDPRPTISFIFAQNIRFLIDMCPIWLTYFVYEM